MAFAANATLPLLEPAYVLGLTIQNNLEIIMDANINSIVKDLKKVPVEQVVFEAITNSIQANANNIKIYFNSRNQSIDDEIYKSVDEIKVIDDGEGFNDKNIESFNTYRSDYKQNLGAKGVGRFLYLKLFGLVEIKSLFNEINFTVKKGVEVKKSENSHPETTLLLSDPKDNYKINKNDFEQKVKNHFLPYFKLLTDQKKSIKILVYFNDSELLVINSNDIPVFETATFDIGDHKFDLSYIFNDNNFTTSDGFYCAANRVVSRNSQLDARTKLKSFNLVNILFLLSSEYFDQNVNDERDELTIKPIQTNQEMYSNLSWDDIQKALSIKIKEVCLQHGIDIEQEAQNNLKQSIEIAPFLARYLDKNESVLSSEDLIKNAKKDYETEKQFLRDDKNRSHHTYKLILNRVVQSELAEYIFDREKIINKLKSIKDEELMEKEIHNLFMQQYTDDSLQNYKSNNLWLFDDRFMTYDKVFSEAQINKIFPELAGVTKRLDLFSIVSNTYEKDDITDIVIIELKRPNAEITPAGAEEQLLEYARYVNNSEQQHKIRIWTYAFLKFNKEVEDKLFDKSYNIIPTHSQYPIYYKYHERPNMIINFMDYTALADDAHTRNQTFINILKGRAFVL